MEKNQEERSLLAEQREQEKEQMLEYMEQLQEEDLRVTGQIMPSSTSSNNNILQDSGVSWCGLIFCQAHAHFTSSSPSTFYCHIRHLFGNGAMLGDEQYFG